MLYLLYALGKVLLEMEGRNRDVDMLKCIIGNYWLGSSICILS